MIWALLGPSLVVIFELLVFAVTVAIVTYAAGEHDRETQPSDLSQPVATEPGHLPPHAA